MRRMLCIVLGGMMALALTGCSVEKIDRKKVQDLEYSIVDKDKIPEEMKSEIEKKKTENFHITYDDGTSLYIGQGYGRKDTSGYSVQVQQCYESSNSVCIKTSLTGPQKAEKISKKNTYPYIVVKLVSNRKSVIFI